MIKKKGIKFSIIVCLLMTLFIMIASVSATEHDNSSDVLSDSSAEISVSDISEDTRYDNPVISISAPSEDSDYPVSHDISDVRQNGTTSVPHIDFTANDTYYNVSYNMSKTPYPVFINQSYEYHIDFTNVGNGTGFNPLVELMLPEAIDNFSASFAGIKINIVDGIYDEENMTWFNPLTNENVTNVPEGYKLHILQIPIGSFTENMPKETVTISGFLSPDVDLGSRIEIVANPVFEYGNDYLGKENATHGDTVHAWIQPTLLLLEKDSSLHEDETATGPNYPFTYYVDINIANGIPVSNITIYDSIPTDLIYLGNLSLVDYNNHEIDPSLYEIIEVPDSNVTGGRIVIKFKEDYKGSMSYRDLRLTYKVFAPKFDNSTETPVEIINPITGATKPTVNTVNVTYNYKDYGLLESSDNYTVYLKSLAIQKYVRDLINNQTDEGITVSGHNLTYTINFEVSDYFAFDNFTLTDTVGGTFGSDQYFINGSLCLIFKNKTYYLNESYYNISSGVDYENYQTWILKVDVSSFLRDNNITNNLTGGLYVDEDVNVGALTGSIKFNTTVSYKYAGGTPVVSEDIVRNHVYGSGNLLNGSHVVSDGSAVWMRIISPDISKEITHINGVNVTKGLSHYNVTAGDNVTFEITVIVPNSVNSFTITDFVTIPLFEVSKFDVVNTTTGLIPTANHWAYASDSDYVHNIDGEIIVPTISVDVPLNTVIVTAKDVYEESEIRVLKFYFTFEVTNEPMADGLFKDNLITVLFTDTNGNTFINQSLVWMLLNEPDMTIDKTVDGEVKEQVGDEEIVIIEDGSKVDYTIVITNFGHANAMNVTICDDFLELFSNLIQNKTVYNLSAKYGNGTTIPIVAEDFFNTSKGYHVGELSWDKTNDSNKIIINYSVIYNNMAVPEQNITNTANITRFSAVIDGPNFTTRKGKFYDNATVVAKAMEFNKEYIGSNDFNSTGGIEGITDDRKMNFTIGESGVFNLTINLAELKVKNLTIEDFAEGLKYLNYTVIYGDGVTYDGDYKVNAYNAWNGSLIDIMFNGTITPSNNTNTNYVIVQVYYVALNNTYNLSVNKLTRTNVANLYWNIDLDSVPTDGTLIKDKLTEEGIAFSMLNDNATYNIYQPHLVISKEFNQTSVEGKENIKFIINATNNGASSAFNTIISDDLTILFANITSNTKENIKITITKGNETGNVNINWVNDKVFIDFGEVKAGKSISVEFEFTIKDNVFIGDEYKNIANITATSMPDNRYNQTRDYLNNNSAILRTDNLTVNKSVINTSINNDRVNVTFGEIVTYNITVFLPIGANDFVLNDTLPQGLEFVNGSLVVSRVINNVNGLDYNVSADGRNIIIHFNEEINDETYITFCFNATVLNSSSIGTKTNNVVLSWANKTAKSSANVTMVQPGVKIDKKFNVTNNIEGGDEVYFVLNATNTGNSSLFNTTITDDLTEFINQIVGSKSNITNIVAIEGNDTGSVVAKWDGDKLVITAGELGIKKSVAIKVNFIVKKDVIVGINYTNVANVSGSSVPDGGKVYVANDSDSIDTNRLNVTKTVINSTINNGKTNVTIGENLTYNISVELVTGNYTKLTIEDKLPVGFEYIDGSVVVYKGKTNDKATEGVDYTVNYDPDTRVISIVFTNEFAQDMIDNYNKVFSVSLDATVLNITNVKAGQTKTNNATLYWNSKNASATANVLVVEPVVNIVKKFNVTVVNGTDGAYFVINVTNKGNSPLFNTTVTDDLSEFIKQIVGDKSNITSVVAIEGNDTGSVVAKWDGDKLVIDAGELGIKKSVAVKVSFVVKDDVVIGSSYVNVADVIGYSVPVPTVDGYVRSYVASASDRLNTGKPSVNKSVNDSSIDNGLTNVTVGENVTYDIVVSLATGNYTNLTVVDVLPDGFKFVSALVNGTEYAPIVKDNKLTFEFINMHSLDYKDKLVIRVVAVALNDSTVVAGAKKVNVANLYSNNTFINNATANVTIVEPSIKVVKKFNVTVVNGTDGAYFVINVTNNGNSPLFNTTITDDLTEFIKNITGDKSNITSIVVIEGNESVVATLGDDGKLVIGAGDLGIKKSVAVKVSFVVKDDVVIGSSYVNVANVTGYSVPMDSENVRVYVASASDRLSTGIPSVNKSVNDSSIDNGLTNVTVGENVTYDIVVSLATGNYTNLTVVDVLPDGFKFVSALVNGTEYAPVVVGGNLTFEFINMHSLDYSDKLVIRVVAVALNNSGVAGDKKVNVANLYSNNIFINNATANVTIVEPVINIDKSTVNGNKFNVSDSVQYNITIKNDGTSQGFVIDIEDVLPEGILYSGINSTSKTLNDVSNGNWKVVYNADNKTLTITADYLNVGDSFTILFDCSFDGSLANILGKNITNIANVTYVSSNGTNPINRTYTKEDNTTVHVVVVDISVNKTATSTIVAGSEVTYEIIVKNNAADTAYDVNLTDIYDKSYLSNVQYSVDGGKTWYDYTDVINLGNLTGASSRIIQIKAKLNASALGILNNTAKVTTITNESNYTNNNCTNLTEINTKAELNVLKVSNITGSVIAGNDISYTVTVSNNGPSDARDVTLSDYFNTNELLNMEYSRDGTTWAIYTNGTIINLGNFTVGQTVVVYFRANVNASARGTINNTANITSTTEHNGTNSSTNITPVITDTVINITKVGNVTNVNPGELISYEINVSAGGISDSFNVTLTDDDILSNELLDCTDAIYFVDGVVKGTWNGKVNLGTFTSGKKVTVVISGIKVKDSAYRDILNVAKATSDEHPEGVVDNYTIHVNIVDLAVNKTSNIITVANYSGNITYYINVTNYGPDGSTNVTVKDILDKDYLKFVNAISSKGSYNDTTGIWTIGDLNNGESATLNITCTVIKTGYIYNNASINGTGHDSNLTNNKDNVTVFVNQTCELTIDKIVDKKEVVLGENVTWTVIVKNKGPDSAMDVNVSDLFNASQLKLLNVIVKVGTVDYTSSYDKVSNSVLIPKLDKGETITITLVTKTLVDNATIVNVANVVSPTPAIEGEGLVNPNGTNKSANNSTVVVPLAVPDVNKTSNVTTVNIGEAVNYTIIVVNNNKVETDYVLVDTLPVGFIFKGASDNGVYDESSHKVTWNLNIAGNSDCKVYVWGVVNVTNCTLVNNVSVANYTANVTVSNSSNITVRPLANITITKEVDKKEVVLGENVTWTIVVINHGPDGSDNVTISDLFNSSELKLLDVKVTINGADHTADYDKMSNSMLIPYLAKNDKVVINLVTKTLVDNATIVNVANVVSPTPAIDNNDNININGTNKSANNSTVVVPLAVPDVNKTSNVTTVNIGEAVNYTIIVVNNNKVETDYVLVDTLPVGFVFVGASDNGVYDGSSHKVTWNLNIAGNSDCKVYVWGVVNVTNCTLVNNVSVANYTANVTVSNSSNITVRPLANITITKEANVTVVNLTDNVTWTIVVINHGPDGSDNVTISDLFNSSELKLLDVKVTINGVDHTEDYNWESNSMLIPYLAKDDEVVITLSSTVIVSNLNITNIATVVSPTPAINDEGEIDLNGTNKSANDTVEVLPAVDVLVIKDVVSYGNYTENITYIISVTNNGPDNATEVNVSDVLPGYLIYGSSIADKGSYHASTGIWNIGDLAVGENVTLTLVCKINKTHTVTNNVTVTSKEFDTNMSNNYDEVSVEIPDAADLVVKKTANNANPTVGDKVVYTIVIKNNGPDTAKDVYAIDKLPDGLKFISATATKGSFNPKTGIWTIGTLKNGESVTMIITTVALRSGIMDNVVIVNSSTFDYNESNNIDNFTIKVTEKPVPPINPTDNGTDGGLSGIPMQHTGNPLFALLIVLFVVPSLLRRKK